MRKPLNEAIPGLVLDAELEAAVAGVYVENITHSADLSELNIVISSDTPIPASVFSLEEIIRRQILKDRNIAVRLIGKVEVSPGKEQRAAGAVSGGNGRPNGGWTRGGRGNGSGNGKRRRPKEEGILYGSTTEGRVTPIEMI
ncbi:MAG: hypothetical protein IJH73_07060, partial [Lachnospiraceae bacterium]|nr:hypothetical protein [Lachnospiraceae bacterium]